jgi:hypothetical protein
MFNGATESVIGSLGKISSDIFGVVAFVVLVTALGLAKSKKIPIVILLSLYPAALIAVFFPFYEYIKIGDPTLSTVAGPLFVLILSTIGAFFILRSYIEARYEYRSFWRFVEVIALSIAIVGLCMALLYHVVEIESYYDFSVIFDTLFASPTALFFWILGPLLSIPLFVRA